MVAIDGPAGAGKSTIAGQPLAAGLLRAAGRWGAMAALLVIWPFGLRGQAQVPPGEPAFEVVSVKQDSIASEVIEMSHGSLTMRHVRLSSCIRLAYGVEAYQIDVKSWIHVQRYSIFAKAARTCRQ